MGHEDLSWFVGIGAQKAGTSWLHAQLVNHPEIVEPPRKEVHYWDTRFTGRMGFSYARQYLHEARRVIAGGTTKHVRAADRMLEALSLAYQDPTRYLQYLAREASAQTHVGGEITPSYSTLSADAFDAMKSLMDPKIIYVMRDPLSRYWSSVRMGFPNHPDQHFARLIDTPGTWSRTDYISTIESVDEVFDQENVCYLFYESLFEDATRRRLLRWLGVDDQVEWAFDTRVRAGAATSMPDIPRSVASALLPIYDYIEERFSWIPEPWRSSREQLVRAMG